MKSNDHSVAVDKESITHDKKAMMQDLQCKQGKLIEDKGYVVRCQLYDTYIVIEKEDKIIIIDQHAAHERLLYEYYKKNLNAQSQAVLISEVIELEIDEIAIIERNYDILESLGLGIDKFGETLIVVHKLPIMLKGCDVKSLIRDLINSDFDSGATLLQKIERIYANIACKNAIKANHKLLQEEIDSLILDIESTDFITQCNHGRPTSVVLKKLEIEKMFERK